MYYILYTIYCILYTICYVLCTIYIGVSSGSMYILQVEYILKYILEGVYCWCKILYSNEWCSLEADRGKVNPPGEEKKFLDLVFKLSRGGSKSLT